MGAWQRRVTFQSHRSGLIVAPERRDGGTIGDSTETRRGYDSPWRNDDFHSTLAVNRAPVAHVQEPVAQVLPPSICCKATRRLAVWDLRILQAITPRRLLAALGAPRPCTGALRRFARSTQTRANSPASRCGCIQHLSSPEESPLASGTY